MTLPGFDSLLVEQPWSASRHLWSTRYECSVYSEQGALLATVTERKRLRPLRKVLRATGFSGRTVFDLVVAQQGFPLLAIRKGVGRPPLEVTRPDGAALGSVRQVRRGVYALLDPAGQQLCLLHEVVTFTPGAIGKRDGRRVRRDSLRLQPNLPESVRSLALAACVAYDVVRGIGTNHTSGAFDFPTA
ncbi:hypothetical protein NLX83_28255 [Allokutzneria sp. A3M-2-11 16]|uniref:hypothetical protein n=1 Tax=Allokutzneria sp. A3M-2-11 16 TaxID=2962043 RepID=UPI0020B8097D|nr:hypothetical protein [Allokutzneria sp. A3M-2-11 16]MCP3803177.1 hypothetical protein [Allokutzneria sp. A3M-2-11 16]